MQLIKSNQVNEIKSVKSCAHKTFFKYYVFLFCSIYIEGTKTKFFFFILNICQWYILKNKQNKESMP